MPLATPTLEPQLRQQLEAELRQGEKIVWADQPLPRVYRRQSIAMVLFGIPFGGFALFWIVTAAWMTGKSHEAGPFSFFPLFGIPFLLVGLGMVSSPIWMSRKARRSIYAITDQRAIVIEGRVFGGVIVQSFLSERLTAMTRKQFNDGSGDLVFEQFQQRAGSGTTTVRRGFMGVRNVRDVEELISKTLLSGRSRPLEGSK